MTLIDPFAAILAERIREGLPGAEAHARMAPPLRTIKTFVSVDYPDARIGCVMLLLFPSQGHVYITLIQRPDYDGVHGGQISFPGGKMEHGDADAYAAALRETEEETGVPKSSISFIGKLSDVYIPPSNFFVHPFVGFVREEPDFKPDPHEVAKIIRMPLIALLKDEARSTMQIVRPEARFETPCYLYEEHRIWGATAIILSELGALIKDKSLDLQSM